MSKLKIYENEIVDKYLNQCYTTKMLAAEYDCHICSIDRLLNRKNVKLRNSKYAFDENYFENIDNEHKAYWLGFMYADGYVNSTKNIISLRLKDDDDYILKEFVKDINSNIEVKYYSNTHALPNGKMHTLNLASVVICSKKMKEDLIKQGCFEKKSLILKFPTTVSNNLLPHFIRGYFDGDGCITTGTTQKNGNKNYSVNFVGTKEFLEGIKKCFDLDNKISKRFKDSNSNTYQLTILGNIKCYDILESLYENSTIHLKRKYNRYLSLLNLVPSISNNTGNNSVNCGNTLRALRTKQSRKLRLWEE